MTTEITNAAWRLADDLKNAEHGRLGSFSETGALRHALARRIQETSDVAKALSRPITTDDFTCEGPLALMRRLRSISKALQSLILPDEKPDPLEEALRKFATLEGIEQECAKEIRDYLAKRGGRIVFDD